MIVTEDNIKRKSHELMELRKHMTAGISYSLKRKSYKYFKTYIGYAFLPKANSIWGQSKHGKLSFRVPLYFATPLVSDSLGPTTWEIEEDELNKEHYLSVFHPLSH